LFSVSFAALAGVYQSTMIMRSALTRFFLLKDGAFATAHSGILASTAAAAPVNVGGNAPATNFEREWCGIFQSTADFATHTVSNDPTTDSFVVHPQVNFNAHPVTYAPQSAGLIDACSAPFYNRNFYGRPFTVQLEAGAPVSADIDAVEAKPADPVFANGFE
jgi:hypothetical protein